MTRLEFFSNTLSGAGRGRPLPRSGARHVARSATALPGVSGGLLCAGVLAAALASGETTGLDDLPLVEEIVVTGEFRAVGVDDVAASVSVLTPNDGRGTAVRHLEEILNWTPNVNFASGASRGRFVQIRGIGETGQFTEPLNSSVGLVLDGVDISGIGTVATTFDVAQVEVFRGPQGTLYGANALAGLINVVSREPEDALSGRVTVDAGNYDSRTLGAVLTGPVGDRSAFRLAGQMHRDDGFIDNEFTGDDDTNDRDEVTLRTKLRWQPSDDSELMFTYGLVDVDNGYDAFSLDNDRNTLSDQPGHDRQETHYGSARLGWDIADAFGLEGTLAYATSDIEYGYDEDWTFDGFHPFGYSSTDNYVRDRDTLTLDVRLVSNDSRDLRWVAGAFVLDQDVDLTREYTFAAGDFTSDWQMRRLAVYGEVTFGVSDRVRLTAGLRGERHSAEYDDSEGVDFDPDDDMVGGRLIAEIDVGDRGLAYASATRGYKAGGFNTSGSLPATLREYDPETLWNYELGYKVALAGGRGSVRASLFYMMRDDVHVDRSITLVREDGSAEFIDFVDNAEEGTNAGVEIETSWFATDRLQLFANVGLLDTERESDLAELDGREQTHAPDYQFHIGGEYAITERWFARVEFEGRDEFFFSNSHMETSDAFELWNASAGYEGDRYSVRMWGRNLTDEDTLVRGFRFGNDPRDGYLARGFTQLGAPRQFGVSVTLEF